MFQVTRTWLAVTGGLAAGAIGVTAFAGATASAAPLQPVPAPTPGVTAPAQAPPNAAPLPSNNNRIVQAPPAANPGTSPVPAAAPAPSAVAPAPATGPTVPTGVTGTMRDYLQSKGVKLEAQKPQGLSGLEITLPVPTRWTQVPDPNVPDAFAVIADRQGNSLYASNAQVVVYKLVGNFDPKEAIAHGFVDSQQLLAWQTTNASQADFMGFPSSIIEGTYRQNDMALNTSRRHVIVTSAKDKYLVSLAVTTALSQATGDGPATDAIINGFRVTVPGAVPPAAPSQAPAPVGAPPAQAPATAPVRTPGQAGAAAPPALPAQAPAVAPAPVGVPAQVPAPATLHAPAGVPAQAPVPGQSLTPQPTPSLLALLPGLPPLPNLHLNLLGTPAR
jgi:hypothetical protein